MEPGGQNEITFYLRRPQGMRVNPAELALIRSGGGGSESSLRIGGSAKHRWSWCYRSSKFAKSDLRQLFLPERRRHLTP